MNPAIPRWRLLGERLRFLLGDYLYLLRALTGTGPKQAPADESLGPARPGEVRPPWIEFPSIGPGDLFWREAGQPWLTCVWEPFYDALAAEAQAAYRDYWQVPQVWWDFYFDPAWRAFLESTDEPEDDESKNRAPK